MSFVTIIHVYIFTRNISYNL